MGEKTLNEHFYKPDFGARGEVEKGKFDDALDRADTQIEANKNLSHTHTNIVTCADYENPDDAITAIGSDNKTLIVTEAETCDANFTVPANVTVRFERGGKWTINTGVTVTFNGQIQAGLWQIFAYIGTGTLNFGTGAVYEIYPQWWGAVGDGSIAASGWTDNSSALQATLDAIAGGGTQENAGKAKIKIPSGWYCFETPLTQSAKRNITIEGCTRESTIFDFRGEATEVAITIDGSQDSMLAHYTMRNFALRDAGNSGAGDKNKNGLVLNYVQASTFENIDIKGFDNGLIIRGNSHLNTFQNCYFRDNHIGVKGDTTSGRANHNSFIGCWFAYNSTNSFNGTYVNNTTFLTCNFEPDNGTLILNSQNSLYGCRVERNTNASTYINIIGNNNQIDNLLVTSSGGYNAGTVLDIDGNYNKVDMRVARSGGNLIRFDGNHNEVSVCGGVLDGNDASARIIDNGEGNILKSPWGYVSEDGTINVITAPLENLINYSNDLSNAAWTKTNCHIGGTRQIIVDDTGHSVSQSFVADRDFISVWVGLEHLKSNPSGQYLRIKVENVTAETSDTTLYITNSGTVFKHFLRCSDIGGSSGDTIKISISTLDTAGVACWVKDIMISLDYPAPFTDGNLRLRGNLKFEGATNNLHKTTFEITDPTADRTITVPDSDQEIGKAKSLNITNQAAGDILYFDGNNWIRLAKGTAGQVLTMNAGATASEWAAGGGGGSSTFTGLTDTPANYTNSEGKNVRVNSTPDAIEFTNYNNVTTKSGTCTLTVAEQGLILVSASSDYTITLPTAVGNSGLTYHFVKTDYNYNLITLDGDGAETFNYENSTGTPNTTYPRLNTYCAEVTVVSDGTNWQVVNEKLGQVPECRVYLSATQSDIADDTDVLVNFNTEEYDIGSNFNTNTHKFVCPVSGKYSIIANIGFNGITANKRYFLKIFKDAANLFQVGYHSSIASAFYCLIDGRRSYSKDEEIKLYVKVITGVATTDILGGDAPYTYLNIRLISKD